MESSGCESRPAKAGQQAGSTCCHSPGNRWVRSVHSKEAGREDSAPKSNPWRTPTLLCERKAVPGRPVGRGRTGAAGVSSSGHAFQGILQEPKRARHLLPAREVPAAEGDRRQPWMGGEQSYRLIVPVKV